MNKNIDWFMVLVCITYIICLIAILIFATLNTINYYTHEQDCLCNCCIIHIKNDIYKTKNGILIYKTTKGENIEIIEDDGTYYTYEEYRLEMNLKEIGKK